MILNLSLLPNSIQKFIKLILNNSRTHTTINNGIIEEYISYINIEEIYNILNIKINIINDIKDFIEDINSYSLLYLLEQTENLNNKNTIICNTIILNYKIENNILIFNLHEYFYKMKNIILNDIKCFTINEND